MPTNYNASIPYNANIPYNGQPDTEPIFELVASDGGIALMMQMKADEKRRKKQRATDLALALILRERPP